MFNKYSLIAKFAWALLAIAASLILQVIVANYPDGPKIMSNPPIYLGPTFRAVVVWLVQAVFALGAVGVWAVVVAKDGGTKQVAVALAAASLIALSTALIYTHNFMIINGMLWFAPPRWVFMVFIAAYASGWVVGIPLLIAMRQSHVVFARQNDGLN